MGFGTPSFSSQNQQMLQSMMSAFSALSGQQAAGSAAQSQTNSGILNSFMGTTAQALGQTPQQQKASVNFGIMDFIKTAPGGLANTPKAPNSAGLSLLGGK